MPELTKLKATCYYPLLLQTLPKGAAGSERLYVHADAGTVEVSVSMQALRSARIEASAMLDLCALGPDAGKLGIAYWGGLWRAYSWAPYGVGDRSNALVPGRDFAHGGQGVEHWPFGTQITFRDRPLALENVIRPQMYHGDDFGDSEAAHEEGRIDLFTGVPCQFYATISVKVAKPWAGSVAASWVIDRDPTKGFQQCANKIGFPGKDGKPLVEDGIWGANTEAAMFQFLAEHDGRFLYGLPDYIKERPRPWDPEIYFHVREAAKEVCE